MRRNATDSTYQLTSKIWELGSHVIGRMDLIRAARPVMARLADLTGETVHLSRLDGTEVVYVDRIESRHHIRAHMNVGARAPAIATAPGKAMLAHMQDDCLEGFRRHLKRCAGRPRTPLEELRDGLELARQQGYAAIPHDEGIAACASVILDGHGKLAGAVGVSGPEARIKRRQLEQIAVYVTDAANSISAELGYRRPD